LKNKNCGGVAQMGERYVRNVFLIQIEVKRYKEKQTYFVNHINLLP